MTIGISRNGMLYDQTISTNHPESLITFMNEEKSHSSAKCTDIIRCISQIQYGQLSLFLFEPVSISSTNRTLHPTKMIIRGTSSVIQATLSAKQKRFSTKKFNKG
ncbi:hypothetical protein LOAG_13264 [Loa loa]|uniref:Uncharacterized protein n=1 Tax=Loa loa TaxID=7209 RepID=A0A1S0TJT7_LOALO|nr:hypothetical protein LOAG_13264 [Loa loa]EFO15250.1 hypothetical protein LOAG_13264 [Loa loa]